jgi:hypothetical protein
MLMHELPQRLPFLQLGPDPEEVVAEADFPDADAEVAEAEAAGGHLTYLPLASRHCAASALPARLRTKAAVANRAKVRRIASSSVRLGGRLRADGACATPL